MKTRLCIILCMVVTMALPAAAAPAAAQEHAREFLGAMEAYKAGNYGEAAKALETIAAAGIHNGQLYYDLGNAYLKSGDLGRAILWYERALYLIPNDPDLRFNYEYARSLTKDAQDVSTPSLVRILFFWKYQLSAGTILVLALAFNLLFWALALAWRLSRRRTLRYAAMAALVPATIFILTAAFNYYEASHRSQAIVLPDKVAVRSGLEPTSTELFELHAGAKVRILRQLKGHVQIRFSEDKIGWIENAAVGRI